MGDWSQHEWHDEEQEFILAVNASQKIDLTHIQVVDAIARYIHVRFVYLGDKAIWGVVDIYDG